MACNSSLHIIVLWSPRLQGKGHILTECVRYNGKGTQISQFQFTNCIIIFVGVRDKGQNDLDYAGKIRLRKMCTLRYRKLSMVVDSLLQLNNDQGNKDNCYDTTGMLEFSRMLVIMYQILYVGM